MGDGTTGWSSADAVAYLLGLQRHGIKLGLETMRALLAPLGNPHRAFRSLHIAGTNGKGSTAALVAAILRAAGYRVGLYTSPHLVDFRERIRIDGEEISDSALATLTARVRDAVPPGLNPTFFECTTAIAFAHFAACYVDVAVIEVGLGGRFDATNVIEPIVSCITTIARDHEAYLGRELTAIAGEKAGIIKSAVPVVVGRVEAEPAAVIARIAEAQQAPLIQIGRDYWVEGATPEACLYHGSTIARLALSCPLRGRHQLDNLACAVATVEAASARGLHVPEGAIQAGVASVQWAGRLELVGSRPHLLLDGAHNPAAAAVVAAYLADYRITAPSSKVWAIVGMMQDKDHVGFLRRLAPLVDTIVFTVPALPRAASGEQLMRALPADAPPTRIVPAVGEALREVSAAAAPDDLICVTGSLMLIGEVKAALQGQPMSPLRG